MLKIISKKRQNIWRQEQWIKKAFVKIELKHNKKRVEVWKWTKRKQLENQITGRRIKKVLNNHRKPEWGAK